MQILKFPNGFLWGAATSAHQIEGNNVNSDWWAWEQSSKRVKELKARGKDVLEYQSGQACDSYKRFDEDFALAQALNHNAHRLSLEWARIEPKQGEISEEALNHYEKVLQSAKFHGLTVFVTLHHFTSPLWFIEKGGFEKKENLDHFVKYAGVVARRLGQYVDFWITINEPEIYSTHSYMLGIFPPQQKSWFKTYTVVKNLITAHNRASEILKYETQKPVSMAFHLADFQPTGFFGGLTKSVLHYLVNEYIISRTIDYCGFIGVNYYNHRHIGFLGPRKHSQSHHNVTDLGWGIHPEGLERVLLYLKKYNKPIYITENGLADAKDTKREQFIKDHLYYTHRAIAQGAQVKGYLYWSLIDNFEWQHGFWPRFGLIEIDRADNLRRKIRHSAIKFSDICQNNSMEY